MKKIAAGLLILATVVMILCSAGLSFEQGAWLDGREPGHVYVDTLGTPDEEVLANVKQTAEFFPQFMAEKFQLKLERPIDIYVGADRGKYEELLRERMHVSPETVKEKAQYTSGQSSGSKAMCVINGDKNNLKQNNNRYSTTAHELFHQMQHELSQGKSSYENTPYWLEEGSADYAGAVVSEAMGSGSVEKWYLDAKFALQYARNPAAVDQLQQTTEDGRMQLLSGRTKSYDLSDVMTYYLLQQYGAGQPMQKLGEFFRNLADDKAETAFAKTFGLEMTDFLQEFSGWWQVECSHPARFHTIIRDNVDKTAVNQFMGQLERAESWLKRNSGNSLKGEYQLVFVGTAEDFAAAEMEYGYISAAEAKSIAAGSVWAENNSTLFINVPQVTDPVQSMFVSAAMLNRLYIVQQLASDDGNEMAWLIRGASYVAGVARLAESDQGDIAAYQRYWRKKLRESQPLPTLDKLATGRALRDAGKTYDSERISNLCEYAAAELVQRYGWRGIYSWLAAARQSGDGKKAFNQVFGITVTDFAAQVHMLIY
ncbi:hypothetical protein SELR_12080 [Selenomonas ruminantium subsp. lactilytica TAM6421]|uniref:DUF1570 domain-containing protein n=1 Tax=Selenomonas ruminantium subsp. lactilytica (strain NBRC 103574 / TAM6421) TaxID=927704 RepID=I0GQ79_SELRL|nr:hypothetical protein [Selenomonas ruminantium]BAL82916.1 hypothetical protein SELR_12080 [Selenomonas ruminantium subsp. lactilytica TAM6421]